MLTIAPPVPAVAIAPRRCRATERRRRGWYRAPAPVVVVGVEERRLVSATPALFTRMSMRPRIRRVGDRASTDAHRARRARSRCAFRRLHESLPRRSRARLCLRAATTTCAPWAASSSAKWRPRPLDAPVTRTRRPQQIAREHRHQALASARARSRSTFFWILPVAVFGSGPNTTCFGTLKCAMRSRHQWMMSAALTCAPALSVTNAHGRLAPVRIGPRDHGRLHHLRMAIQALLDLERADVLAARDDDVLAAVLDLDVAVRMPDGEVAGVVPAVRERRLRRRRVLEIALHDRVAAKHHLAERRAVARHRLRRLRDRRRWHPRASASARPGAPSAVRAIRDRAPPSRPARRTASPGRTTR